jgi:hypothetical protein
MYGQLLIIGLHNFCLHSAPSSVTLRVAREWGMGNWNTLLRTLRYKKLHKNFHKFRKYRLCQPRVRNVGFWSLGNCSVIFYTWRVRKIVFRFPVPGASRFCKKTPAGGQPEATLASRLSGAGSSKVRAPSHESSCSRD